MHIKLSTQYILFFTVLQLVLFVVPVQSSTIPLSPDEQDWLANHKVIRFGFADDIEPFAILEPDGTTSGIAQDMLDLMAERLGTKISLELKPWVIILEKAKKHEIDAIPGIMPEHGKAFNLDTSITLRFNSTPTAYIHENSTLNIRTKEDLRGKRIVVLKGMYYVTTSLKPIAETITRIEVDTCEEAFTLLLKDEADVFLGLNIDHYVITKKFIVDIKPAIIFWDETFYVAMGVRNDDPVLQSLLKKAYDSISANEIIAIQRRWLNMPTEKPTTNLTQEEQNFIKKHQTIQVGVDLNFAPFEFLNPQTGVQGMSHDLLKIIAQNTGLTFLPKPQSNIDTLRHQIQTGTIDMLSTQIRSEQSNNLIYSDAFMQIPLVILAPKGIDFVTGLDNIKNKRIGVVQGYFPEEYLQTHYPDTPLVQYKSLQEGLFALSQGQCDFFLESLPQANHIIRSKGIDGINLVGKTKQDFDFCFAIRKNLPELRSILNKNLASIPYAQKLQIQQRLTSLTVAKQINWQPLMQIATIAIIIILIMLVWNRRLQREIKARKSAERSLHLAKLTLDKIPLHLFWFNDQFEIAMANKAAQKATGLSLEDLRKIHAWDIDPSFAKETSPQAWNEVKDAGSIDYLGQLRQHDGSVIPTEGSLTFLEIEKSPPYVVSIGADISIRKTHENQLKDSEDKLKKALLQANESSRLKSEFLSNMSHEIRTPLNAIIGYSEMLGQGDVPTDKHRYIETIISSGKTLVSLIDDILDLSKLEAGKMQIVPIAINPKVFFTNIINIFKPKLHEKELQHSLSIDSHLPEALLLDEVRLRQILFNVIGNGIKFTDNGTIDIGVNFEKTAKTLGTLTITVTDTGIGISQEDQQLIFESFQQKSGGVSRQYGGTGLGLTISKRFVELMSGQILLESTVGKGSCFTITLPHIPISGSTVAPEKIAHFDLTSLAKSTILITDDIKTNRDLIKACLQHTPLTILTATNGEEAIKITQSHELDLIFMDIKMDIMDGIEATKILKQNPATQNIPVIALSGADLDDDVRELFDDFLQKPFSLRHIHQKIQHFLSFTETEDIVPDASPEQEEKSPLNAIEEETLLQAMNNAINTGTLTAYKSIADILKQLGRKHNNKTLQNMSTELADNVKCGAIIQIEDQLIQLENFLQDSA